MEKKELNKLLDSIFIPLGFKRKGNNWISNSEEINKMINLQKSQYSNAYYINYDYIINSLPLLNRKAHIGNRLASHDKEEQKRITDLLNLENDIETSERLLSLWEIINAKIVAEIKSIHSEEDMLGVLKARKYLYTIPPLVLKHFNLTTT